MIDLAFLCLPIFGVVGLGWTRDAGEVGDACVP